MCENCGLLLGLSTQGDTVRHCTLTRLVAGAVLIGIIALSACGPSREQRVRTVFEKHKKRIAQCQTIAAEVSGSGIGALRALQQGNTDGALDSLGQQGGSYNSFVECIDEVKARIEKDLKAKGLADAPEVDRIWREYTRKERAGKTGN